MKRKMSDTQLEVTLRLFNQIVAGEKTDSSLWAVSGFRAYCLSLFDECAKKVSEISGDTDDMTLILQTIERPPEWSK